MIIDVHIHCALSGVGKLKTSLMKADTPERQKWFESLIARYKNANVCALRDGGDRYGLGTVFKPIAEDHGVVFRTPIKAFYKKKCYGEFLGVGVTDLKSCRKEMTNLLKKKPDFIKIIQSGIMSFEHYGESGDLEFTDEELRYLIAHAHDVGLKAMIHVNTPKGIMMAIEAGADSIEHGYGIDDDCIKALSESQTVWVPTLAPFANIADCGKSNFLYRYRDVSKRYYEDHSIQVEKAYRLGVCIALGSDSGASLVLHGQGCYDELKYLKKCGLAEKELFANGCRVMDLDLNQR
ncbi:MAG: amidohydrolase family protein [Eubacterium sp.]